MIITSRADAGQLPQNDAERGWQSTRAQTAMATQLADDEEQYLGGSEREIGRAVGTNDRELFVSCAPGEALRQQFEHLQLEFIAVHDIATRSSRQLVGGLAAAGQRAVQKLSIRRQGHGTTLASIDFVDLSNADGTRLRIFSTDAQQCDGAERAAIARTLLAFSRLGVMMVGELPATTMGQQFGRWHNELVSGSWPNRHLLLLPLSSANALATQGLELARGSAVQVRTTPKVTRATDAWGFIESTWARLRGQLDTASDTLRPLPPAQPAVAAPSPPAEPTALQLDRVSRPMQLDLKPMPAVAGRLEPAAGAVRDEALARYVAQVGELAGMVSCCVFDVASGREMMHAGADPWQVELARHGSELLGVMAATGRALGLGRALPEAAITLGDHHLLLRGVPKRPGLALHAVLDKATGNLALARLRLERLDEVLSA